MENDKVIIYQRTLFLLLCETRTQPTQNGKNGMNRTKLMINPTVP